LPGQTDLGDIEAGAGVPEPDGFRDRAGGQALGFEAAHGAFDDRQGAVVAGPGDAELRLITCVGRYDAANRNYLDNVIVYAKPKR
jgi:hypothetical protein